MPLMVLLPLVILGIGGIALLLHLTGHTQNAAVKDTASAQAAWLRHWPRDTPRAVHLSKDMALVVCDQGVGLVRPFGMDTVAHFITSMEQRAETLVIGFDNFAAPSISLNLDQIARDAWLTAWRQAHA